MLRTLAAQGERYMEAEELAAVLGKKPSGGHWNSGIAVLRNNGLIETEPAPAEAGGKVVISPAQLGMLLEGIDWRMPRRTWQPQLAG